ncbi:hypothetical protein Acr_02g0009140 [Actinidia rufa]|uniref:CCHC-type domain-containing protein n=1 Tax=Actinidia rufa TaxID=165716 RepID=A0A7J0E871_9ERIC|nr:hypothetical protein Acr_02g0009140 [Actinidia rufa]
MEHAISSLAYKGSIVEAIAEAKRQKKLFVVYISVFVVNMLSMELGCNKNWASVGILNTSPLPSLYEAFAIIDGDERHRRLISASPAISPRSTPIADQMAFAASGSDPRSFGGKPTCSYCGNIGHIREKCFKLKRTLSKRKGKGLPSTVAVAETSPGHVPNVSHIQSQLGLLQSQLGPCFSSNPQVLLPL